MISDQARCMKISYIITQWKKGKKTHPETLAEIKDAILRTKEITDKLFTPLEDLIKETLGGLTKKINWTIDGSEVRIWSSSDAFNMTRVVIQAMRNIGFEVKFITLAEEKALTFGGEDVYKPMIVFSRVRK